MEDAARINTVVAELVALARHDKKLRRMASLPQASVVVTARNAPGARLVGDSHVEVDPETWAERTPREVAHMAWGNRVRSSTLDLVC